MKAAQQYINQHRFDNVEFGGFVKSNSGRGHYFVSKINGKWYCNCTAGMMKQDCKHIEYMATKVGEGDKCFNCGTSAWAAGGLDENHVLLRSTHPELIDDPDNKMKLCRKCHDRFHSDTEFQTNLQTIWKMRKEEKLLLKQQ